MSQCYQLLYHLYQDFDSFAAASVNYFLQLRLLAETLLFHLALLLNDAPFLISRKDAAIMQRPFCHTI